MHRLDHTTVVRAGASVSTPLSRSLVAERLRGPGHDIWMGWTVEDDVVVVAVAGDLCTAGVPMLHGRIEELVLQYPARTVLLDLSRVDFADARAVTMLVQIDRLCRTSGSDLEITATGRALGRVLDLCGWPVIAVRGAGARAGSRGGAEHRDGETIAVRRHVDPIHN
jgi:anti-anti-sigma factor